MTSDVASRSLSYILFKLPNSLGHFDLEEPLNAGIRHFPRFIADPNRQQRPFLVEVEIIQIWDVGVTLGFASLQLIEGLDE